MVEITGTINHSTVELFKESLQRAQVENSEAVILLLDTPGGGLAETFEIADIIQNSSIPIVGYVYPPGASSVSAGTYILMSTHVAAMAEYTIIGSCQPVEITLEGTKLVNDSKRINFLVAWMRTRAELHNRNTSIVERCITENLNLNATLAHRYGVIEYVSSSPDHLLENMNGTSVTTSQGVVTLYTSGAKQLTYTPSLKIQITKIISNPLLTSLLFMIGVFSLIFGISAPGYGAEVFGVIAILLALIGSGFDIPVLSIIFIIIGSLMLIIEIFATPGFGVIGIGGIICLLIGSLFLVPSYSTTEWVISMDWINDVIMLLLFTAVLIAAFFAFLLYKILEIRKKKKAMGTFIGEQARTIDRITPDHPGFVRFKGEYWKARADIAIEPNTKVEIVAKEESMLIVKPVKE
jgi:membrane-bound serine protease (ClpP class)